jgi:hypothetical protein
VRANWLGVCLLLAVQAAAGPGDSCEAFFGNTTIAFNACAVGTFVYALKGAFDFAQEARFAVGVLDGEVAFGGQVALFHFFGGDLDGDGVALHRAKAKLSCFGAQGFFELHVVAFHSVLYSSWVKSIWLKSIAVCLAAARNMASKRKVARDGSASAFGGAGNGGVEIAIELFNNEAAAGIEPIALGRQDMNAAFVVNASAGAIQVGQMHGNGADLLGKPT